MARELDEQDMDALVNISEDYMAQVEHVVERRPEMA